MKETDVLGRWTLQRLLGRGGNGEVWLAQSPAGESAAVKVLSRRGGDRLPRFLTEIEFLLTQDPGPGVLPLIDHDLAVTAGNPWFAMPVATPILEALGPDSPPEQVVTAVRDIAAVLARLADRGIGHRDIKPANLYLSEGVWSVGDFGLVKYPEKDQVTRGGRRLGPADFLAPEMRADADTAEPEPADVHAMAKTLWVLATGRDLPLPGPHRADDPAYRVGTYLAHARAGELDVLLEAATRHEPTERVRMADFVAQLDAWLLPPPEELESPDVAALAARIGSLTEPARRLEEDHQGGVTLANEALNEINRLALDHVYHDQFGPIPGLETEYVQNSGAFRAPTDYNTPDEPILYQQGWAVVGTTSGEPLYGIVASGAELLPAKEIRLTGVVVFEDLGKSDGKHYDVLWSDSTTAPMASSTEKHARARIAEGLVANAPLALKRLAAELAKRRDASS